MFGLDSADMDGLLSGELGDHRVAHERDGGSPGFPETGDQQRRDAVDGGPERGGGVFDRCRETSRRVDCGDAQPQPIVRGERGSGGPSRRGALEHQAVVRRMREPVLDVAREAPAQRLDGIRPRPPAREGPVEFRKALVDEPVDECALVAEVMVDGRRRHAGASTELADREPRFSAARQQRLRRREDRAPRGGRAPIAGAQRRCGRHGSSYSAVITAASTPPIPAPHPDHDCTSDPPCYVWGAMRRSAALVALLAALAPLCASAVQLEALDLARTWRLRTLRFRGVSAVRRGDLRRAMSTKPRPWLAVWRGPRPLDPLLFRPDLHPLRHFYPTRRDYPSPGPDQPQLPGGRGAPLGGPLPLRRRP